MDITSPGHTPMRHLLASKTVAAGCEEQNVVNTELDLFLFMEQSELGSFGFESLVKAEKDFKVSTAS